ncbi:MAG: enoyl-CoA hydratase [Proteobacteria bacterium]|nr:enoyl-CoA hydratase [Pseudomonadota bacterium]
MTELILVESKAGVCHLRLNRPEKRNAITFAMYAALEEALRSADADEGVRALVLSGEGPGFCAGNDLQDFIHGGDFSASHPVLGFLRQLVRLGKPLVAAVHGQAVGIGVTMILHCDLVVAADNTRFSMPFVSLGLVPEAASSLLLPQRLGPQRAAELLLLGRPFDAAYAQSVGIVNRVVAEGRALGEALEMAATLAAQPPQALRATRRLLRGELAAQLERIDAEANIFGAQLKSAEFMSAVQAFLARGKSR